MENNTMCSSTLIEQRILNLKEATILEAINDGGQATFATIQALTDLKMNKKNNPLYGQVTKLKSYNVQLNCIYENAVINQLKREGKEESEYKKGDSWHKKVYDTKNGSIVCNKIEEKAHERYLMAIVANASTDAIYVNGIEATKEQMEIIKMFEVKPYPPKNQGTDKPIIINTIKIDNIKKLNVNRYKLQWD